MTGVRVLVTNWGEFLIPDEIARVTKFTKSGWPHKRSDATAFWNWYETLKQAA